MPTPSPPSSAKTRDATSSRCAPTTTSRRSPISPMPSPPPASLRHGSATPAATRWCWATLGRSRLPTSRPPTKPGSRSIWRGSYEPRVRCVGRHGASSLHQHLLLHPILGAKNAQIAGDLPGIAGRLLGIVGELYRRTTIGARHLAHQRDGLEAGDVDRRAALEIIGEVGTPAESHPYPAIKMVVRFLDGIDIKPIRKDQQFFARVTAALLPPRDDFLPALDGRRAVGPEAGPVGHPVGRIAQEGCRAEGIGQNDQEIAAIILLP